MKYLLGFDIGSSSIKTALLDASSGIPLATTFSPSSEMPIDAPRPGFAEQDPERWWLELAAAIHLLRIKYPFAADDIISIGISYQMHGLVCIGREGQVLRPAIIWCDSRAVSIGNKAFDGLRHDFCFHHFLNAPGNFTASKLKWVMDNEPEIYKQIFRVLLPGDFIALRLTGEAVTTASGLSEGIFWDYTENGIAQSLLDFYGLDASLLAPVVETFAVQGTVTKAAAHWLGIRAGTPVSYRAGDQPNNAFSLQVLDPGDIAATAGTSGVLYGVTNRPAFDPASRVNPFIHVNHRTDAERYGILMCLNGTGSLNSWLRKNFFANENYDSINQAAAQVPIGAGGIRCFPFGNGAERILENKNPGAQIRGLDFNRHQWPDVARAAQEGIVFSLFYGMQIMEPMGLSMNRIKAGAANMFLSPIFAQSLSSISNCPVMLYNTDGAVGAARGAGIGAGYYQSTAEAFRGMELVREIHPDPIQREALTEIYHHWKSTLHSIIQ